jgi:hypothetical protein
MSIYTDAFKTNPYNIKDAAKKSQDWFQQQVRSLSAQRLQPRKIIDSSPEKNSLRVVPGSLYFFQYDAKTQDSLPYWDMFPLVFPFSKLRDGFIGLNMHYLPYSARVQLLEKLMEFQTNKKMDNTTRIKYSWATINGVSRFSIAKPCVHRYLSDYLQSPMKKIDPVDWVTAMMLPVERFVGATKQKVWTESLR